MESQLPTRNPSLMCHLLVDTPRGMARKLHSMLAGLVKSHHHIQKKMFTRLCQGRLLQSTEKIELVPKWL